MSQRNSEIKTQQECLPVCRSLACCAPQKGGNKTNNEYGLSGTFQVLSDKWNVKSTGLAHLHSADQWGNCSFTYCAFSCVQLQSFRYCSVLKNVHKATMLSCWCGLFLPPLSHPKREKNRYNKCKYQRGWEDWNLKKSQCLYRHI